ncbi:MAG: YeaH/YhbH family protein [bacterium]|nr:YeaH/YhbH family protein [bacterium]
MSATIIDRRLNPSDKNLPNRQRFLRRGKELIKKAVHDAVSKRNIKDIMGGGSISIPHDGIDEPKIYRGQGGIRRGILPGNKEFVEGDILKRPEGGGGGPGDGDSGKGPGKGESQDPFRFVLTREEFLKYFFEDLELPDLVKRQLSEMHREGWHRAGYTLSGSPGNLALNRTMKNAMARRLALHRPKSGEIETLEEELWFVDDEQRFAEIVDEIEKLKKRQRRVPYIDPIDVRYRRLEPEMRPITKAVVFFLMDVSGSMSEHLKDLAKRFFMLLYVFLTGRYKYVEVVFIRHTDHAKEVDEETFFRSTESGGTQVSTAFELMEKIIKERYPVRDWNIYVAEASDGDNPVRDGEKAVVLIRGLLPIIQYFAYLEVAENEVDANRTTQLWKDYEAFNKSGVPKNAKLIAMRKAYHQSQIFPIFADLFKKAKATT